MRDSRASDSQASDSRTGLAQRSGWPRVIVYTGKGGVGKSTVAAATATLAAAQGLRTLVMSVDSAHNLSDIFTARLGAQPTQLADHLEGLEVNVNYEIRENWSAVIDFFRNLTVSSSLANQVVAEECAILPGMEEVFGLTRLRKLAESGRYDLIVVDSPPTGDMMKILRMPDVLDWFMRRYYPLEKRIAQNVWPLVSKMSGAPLPRDEYFQNVERTYEQVQRVSQLLSDHATSSLRLVMTPDTISLSETKRAYATASLFGFNVDAIVINKVLPKITDTAFLAGWMKTQERVLAEANEAFAELPRFQGPWQGDEPLGLQRLQDFGQLLYADQPPQKVYVSRPAMEVVEANGQLEVHLRLPFIKGEHFELFVKDNTLLLSVQTTRRQIPLPRAFEGRQMKAARYEDDALRIQFSGPAATE